MVNEDQYVYNPLIVNGDMSSNINSVAVSVAGWNGFAVQSVYTGVPVGQLSVQLSCDLTNDAGSVTNWDEIGDVKAIVGAGSHTFVIREVKWKWFRLVYSSTSGSGTINSGINFRRTY
jgi:hypothetical protein